jgi:ribosomal protein L7/L12
MVTAQGTIPMSDSYSGGKQSKTEMRERILRFMGKNAGSVSEADESSIRSLLAQGRKIDAIQLLRSSRNIGLTEAKQQVEAIEAQTETH